MSRESEAPQGRCTNVTVKQNAEMQLKIALLQRNQTRMALETLYFL